MKWIRLKSDHFFRNLLAQTLLKHTSVEHPDHQPLLLAQKEIHELALNINSMEKETALIEQSIQKVKEIESIVEGAIDVSYCLPILRPTDDHTNFSLSLANPNVRLIIDYNCVFNVAFLFFLASTTGSDFCSM